MWSLRQVKSRQLTIETWEPRAKQTHILEMSSFSWLSKHKFFLHTRRDSSSIKCDKNGVFARPRKLRVWFHHHHQHRQSVFGIKCICIVHHSEFIFVNCFLPLFFCFDFRRAKTVSNVVTLQWGSNLDR